MVVFTLTLVRHGETVANRKNIIQGQKDWHLSATGLDQVRLVAGRLQNENFTHVFASDLNRAAETAKVIVEGNKSCERSIIVHDKRLRERKFGIIEGKYYRELVNAAKKINTSVANYTPTGAETLQQIQERAKSFFKDLCEQVRKISRVEEGNYTPAPIKRRYEDAIDGHQQEHELPNADTPACLVSVQPMTTTVTDEDSEHKRRRHTHSKDLGNPAAKLEASSVTEKIQNIRNGHQECCSATSHELKNCRNNSNDPGSSPSSSQNSTGSGGTKNPPASVNGGGGIGCGGDECSVAVKSQKKSKNPRATIKKASTHLNGDCHDNGVFNSGTKNSTANNNLVSISRVSQSLVVVGTATAETAAAPVVQQSPPPPATLLDSGTNGVGRGNLNGTPTIGTSSANGNGALNGSMKRSNSSSSSGFSSLQEESEVLDSDDNSITARLDDAEYGNADDDDDDDDDDDFCGKDSDSCYDSPFTEPVSDAEVRGNIPCPKSTKHGCPNVSLSPLLEHRHSNLSSMSSGRSSSFDDGDSCHQSVADVLIVSHGGLLKELIRIFVDELECKFPGGKGHALRVSPNTGVSKFTITVSEPNKILATCLLIHDKDHLLNIYGSNSILPSVPASKNYPSSPACSLPSPIPPLSHHHHHHHHHNNNSNNSHCGSSSSASSLSSSSSSLSSLSSVKIKPTSPRKAAAREDILNPHM